MAGELSRLSRRAFTDVRLPEPKKHGQGQLVYPFEPRVAALAARYHRTCARALWDVCESRATRLEALAFDVESQVAGDTRGWLWDGCKISVQTYRVEEFAAGERQVVGTIKNAVIAGAAQRGLSVDMDPANPDVLLNVRLWDGALRVSVDLGGRPLHQRGYRLAAGEAPLREDLAANLLMLCRYDARTESLIDPMAGSGTIPIEAVCMAQGRPLLRDGEPLANRLPALRDAFQAPPAPLFGDTAARVVSIEVDAEAFAAQQDNLRRAGVNDVRAVQGDFRSQNAQSLGATGASGVILSNPPYGERMGDPKELRNLYADLGRWCREFRGWRAAFIVAHDDFERCFGRQPRITKPLKNGPLNARFLLYDL